MTVWYNVRIMMDRERERNERGRGLEIKAVRLGARNWFYALGESPMCNLLPRVGTIESPDTVITGPYLFGEHHRRERVNEFVPRGHRDGFKPGDRVVVYTQGVEPGRRGR